MRIACFLSNDAIYLRVREALTREDLICERFDSETALMRASRYRNFDLIVIDPGTTSQVEERLLSWLTCRAEQGTPVIWLSPINDARHTACTLEAGADDVLAEDVDPAELLARIHSVLRRYDRRLGQRTRIDMMGFTLDRESGQCFDRGTPVELTPREFAMAWLLFCNPGHYLTRRTISAAIWGVTEEIAGRTIEQHVYKLRKKLRLGIERGVTIRTAYAQGYRLEPCGETTAAVQPISAALMTYAVQQQPVAG